MPLQAWDTLPEVAWPAVLFAAIAALVLGLLAHRLGAAVVLRLTRSTPVAATIAALARRPAQFAVPLVALQAVGQAAPDGLRWITGVRHFSALLLLATLTRLGVRALRGVALGVIAQHPSDVQDNLQARRIQTQARVLARTAMVAIVLAGLALMLMTFPGARQVGASLLASAGVVGIVAGIAARPVFSNLIAGLQLALAQPIRIDDVLIVQGEWGRVEEIAAPEWDQRLCLLQVTEAGERAVQLRVLVTSRDSGQNWDLRCKVREALIELMQRKYAHYLPQLRAAIATGDGVASGPLRAQPIGTTGCAPVGPVASECSLGSVLLLLCLVRRYADLHLPIGVGPCPIKS